MTNEKIAGAINQQISKELFSAYLYLAIANYYADANLEGFSNWFEIQAKEELDHAMLLRQYLINSGDKVKLFTVEAPNDAGFTSFDQPLAVAYKHEKMITASINDIYSSALEAKDYQTAQFLDWFIKEQGEEEKNSSDLCKKYDMFGNDAKGLYLLNAELLTRVYTPPSLVL